VSPLSTSVKVVAGSASVKAVPTVAVWVAVCAAKTGASLAPWMVIGEAGRGGGTGSIAHRVAEHVAQRVGRLAQCLHSGIGSR
jgi:hypothetical protein